MRKKNLIAFDFDGTLYPIVNYDSEQRLMLRTARDRGLLARIRTQRAVRKDQRGDMLLDEFNHRYAKHLVGCKASFIDEVAQDLFSLVDIEQFRLLESLAEKADLIILSCGSENIIHKFLSLHKIDHLFKQVSGKSLHFGQGSRPTMQCTIDGPEGKRTILADLKQSYEQTIAIGDGPTDIPMLEEADLGLIINWDASPKQYPFASYTDLHTALERCHSYLDKAREA